MTISAEHYTTTVGAIEIIIAPPEHPPCSVDAVVEEQDTCLLLGDTHVIRDTAESYAVLVGRMKKQAPLEPGRVLVKHTRPRKLIAVVYDIGKQPVYREEWIATALARLFEEVETRRIKNIALPLLGAAHGRYPFADFLELLWPRVTGVQSAYPEKIWLITPAPECPRLVALLAKMRIPASAQH